MTGRDFHCQSFDTISSRKIVPALLLGFSYPQILSIHSLSMTIIWIVHTYNVLIMNRAWSNGFPYRVSLHLPKAVRQVLSLGSLRRDKLRKVEELIHHQPACCSQAEAARAQSPRPLPSVTLWSPSDVSSSPLSPLFSSSFGFTCNYHPIHQIMSYSKKQTMTSEYSSL